MSRKAADCTVFGILLLIDLVEHLLAGFAEQELIEHDALLPGLAAERDRDEARRLELVHGGEEFVPVLGRLGAGLLERRGRGPHPVLAVHIDRDRIDLAVAGDRIEEGRRQEVAPLALGRHLIDVVDEPLRDDVVELLAGVELHGGRRIAADDPVDRRGAGILADGDGGIDPFAARRVEGIGEDLDGRALAARRPPMDDFRLERLGRGRARRGQPTSIRREAARRASS